MNRITYNALGSVVTDNIYANASATTPLSSKSYTYYPTGAVASVTEDGITMSYTYDERGNVLTETTGTTVNSYTYDTVNNRTGHTLTVGGTTVSSAGYVYDIRNRMSMVMDNQGMTSYEYNLDNTRSAEATYTGTGALISRTTYTYAVTGVLSALETINASTTLARYSYTYYADGNIRTETDVLANTTTTYTYDNAGRLKTEVSPAGTYSYTYDAAGNRATMTENGTTTTYTYDKNNRLLTETKPGSVKSYTYDANGNMLTGDGATYTYDARGRQSGVVKGTASASYTYYPTGLRKTKLAGGANTTFVWDGSNMVLEYTNSAASGKEYVYGLTLISQGNSLYYIYNAHGDVVKYINSSGTVLRNYEYDAFGEEVNASSTDTNPFRYAGQYFDSETGTYYLRARYYNPALGRFTQADKHWHTGNMLYGDDPLMLSRYIAKPDMLAIMQGINLYAYCIGNPVVYVDEEGEKLLYPGEIHNQVVNRVAQKYGLYKEQIIDYEIGYGRADLISKDGEIWEVKRDRVRQIKNGVKQVEKYKQNTWRKGKEHNNPKLRAGGPIEYDTFLYVSGSTVYRVDYRYVEGGVIAYDYYEEGDPEGIYDFLGLTLLALLAGGSLLLTIKTGGAALPGVAAAWKEILT